MSFFLCLNKNKRAYSRLLKQRKFKIENLENEFDVPTKLKRGGFTAQNIKNYPLLEGSFYLHSQNSFYIKLLKQVYNFLN